MLAEPDRAPAPPWDDRTAVLRHIADSLPGTTFDAGGVGVFARRSYTITFVVPATDYTVIDVTATDAAAEQAVLRVAERAGWALLDFDSGRPLHGAGAAAPRPVSARFEIVADSRWRSAAKVAAWVGGLALAVVWAFTFTPAPPAPLVIDTPAPGGAAAVAGARPAPAPQSGGLLDPTLRRASGEALPAAHVAALRREIDDRVRALNRRAGRLKKMAPRFRDDVVANELLDYFDGSIDFMESYTASGYWLPPATLTTLPRNPQLDAHGPKLPERFSQPERHGYRFQFTGDDCSRRSDRHWIPYDLCRGGVYTALPVTAGPASFALHLPSGRIYFRADGQPPTPDDPTIANMQPSHAGDLPVDPPDVTTDDPDAKPWFGMLAALFERAFGPGGSAGAIVEIHEGKAVEDLRAYAQAQYAFSGTLGGGRYGSLAVLTKADVAAGALPPFLPEYFDQPLRLGYRFEATGRASADRSPYGPLLVDFVYVARPVEPGPAGRRSLAVFADFSIHVTSEPRAPTTKDPPLGSTR